MLDKSWECGLPSEELTEPTSLRTVAHSREAKVQVEFCRARTADEIIEYDLILTATSFRDTLISIDYWSHSIQIDQDNRIRVSDDQISSLYSPASSLIGSSFVIVWLVTYFCLWACESIWTPRKASRAFGTLWLFPEQKRAHRVE